MKKVFDEEFHEKYYLQVGSYYNSNRLAITVCKDNDEYVEDITVNQPLVELKDDNQILLSNHISNGVKYLLLDRGIISKTLEIKEYGNIKYQVVNVDLEKLKEYDLKNYNKDNYPSYFNNYIDTLSNKENLKYRLILEFKDRDIYSYASITLGGKDYE